MNFYFDCRRRRRFLRLRDLTRKLNDKPGFDLLSGITANHDKPAFGSLDRDFLADGQTRRT